jgi:hydroxymethylglutaryl-CoA lyase
VSDLPKHVEFHEEGPREGFQIEKQLYPLEQRAALVDALSGTGLVQIQVASFVNPKAVPAMADADRLFGAIRRKPGVRYTALWLNEKGFERAAATPGVDLDGKLMFYATDGLSMHNNNRPAAVMHEQQVGWGRIYRDHGVPLESAYIMAAFGCNFDGPVPLERVVEIVRFIAERFDAEGNPVPRIYLADTVGWANPAEVTRRIAAVRELVPNVRIGLHLHDTRGLGGANVFAALQMGIDLFDSSVAGLGGCPFANHGDTSAAGNVCTEDMVYLCGELGIETGIDLEALIEAGRLAERIIGRKLNGKLIRNGSLSKFRRKAS